MKVSGLRSSSTWRLSVLGLAGAGVVLAVIVGASYHRLARLQEATQQVAHTQLVRNELEGVLELLTDAETGQRGFLITGAPSYLEPYNTALASLGSHREQLRRLTGDNPKQQAHLATLDALIQQKLNELSATI